MISTVEKIKANPKLATLMTASVVESSGNLKLPAGRMLFPALFKSAPPSKGETNPLKFQYGMTHLVPAEFSLAALEKAINDLFLSNVPEAQRATIKWRNPMMKTASDARLAGFAEDYPYMLRVNSKQFQKNGKERSRPDVIDAKGLTVSEDRDPDEIFPGRWNRPTIQPYWYPATQGIAGVSLGLVNVQLLHKGFDDDPIAGGKVAASKEFEPVDLDEDEDVAEAAYE